MSLEAHITRAVTEALQGASKVVGFNGAQTGDVSIGYIAGGYVNITINVILQKSGGGLKPPLSVETEGYKNV